MIGRLAKVALAEPLVHFLVLALAILALGGAFTPLLQTATQRIEVSRSRIDHLVNVFVRTRQRAPTPEELRGLVDDYIREEVYYREALAIGLDQDDTVVRRRLRQKMEFLTAAEAEASEPAEPDLHAHLTANAARFVREPEIAFEQVYLGNDRGASVTAAAQRLVADLNRGAAVDPAALGSRSLLPPLLPLTGAGVVQATFGGSLAQALLDAPIGRWAGPFQSGYGLHLVRVTARTEARTPGLDEIRDSVRQDWLTNRRAALQEERYRALLERYEIVVDPVGGGS